MTTRPTDIPVWATSGTITEPSSGQQAAGFLLQDFPPFQWVNWFWNRTALWAAHFAGAASKFATLEDAASATQAGGALLNSGDTFILDEQQDSSVRFGETTHTANPGSMQNIIVANGRAVLLASGTVAEVYAYSRDLSTLIRTFSDASVTLTYDAIASDGEIVVGVSAGSKIVVWNYHTGATLWTATASSTGNLEDIAIGADLLYFAYSFDGSGGNGGVLAYNRAAPATQAWDFDHAGSSAGGVWSISYNGQYVFLIGDATGSASGATFRAINAVNGRDLTNEGGLGTEPDAWNSTLNHGHGAGGRYLLSDLHHVYINDVNSGNIRRYGAVAGPALGAFNTDYTSIVAGTPNAVPRALAIDNDYLWAACEDTSSSNGFLVGICKYSMRPSVINQLGSKDVFYCDTDGHAVYMASNRSGAQFERIERGTLPGLWRFSDPSDTPRLPMRQSLHPCGRTA